VTCIVIGMIGEATCGTDGAIIVKKVMIIVDGIIQIMSIPAYQMKTSLNVTLLMVVVLVGRVQLQ